MRLRARCSSTGWIRCSKKSRRPWPSDERGPIVYTTYMSAGGTCQVRGNGHCSRGLWYEGWRFGERMATTILGLTRIVCILRRGLS